jgi:CDP-ribitol ribitolphosphotransferase
MQTSDAASAVATYRPRGVASMRFFISVATLVARCVYAALKAVVPVRRKVVFLSRQSDVPSPDFTRLADALRAKDPKLEIVMRCRMLGAGPVSRTLDVLTIVGQMYHLASARACVVDGYVIPVSLLRHREGFFVVQMWHALGAVKKFGYQTIGRPGGRSATIASKMRMHRNYDLVLCSGPGTIPFFAEAFDVDPGVVSPLGAPRVDYLLEVAQALPSGGLPAGAASIRSTSPLFADCARTVVLYAPTFRRAGGDRYRDVAARFADDRYALIVKPHPLEGARIEGANIVNAGGADILDVLPLCDAVITDYSAVAFEAAVMGLPVYFYVYDIDDYVRDHGLNIDPLVEMPEVSSRDIGALGDLIDIGAGRPRSMEEFRERYASAPRGCADRIAARILQAMKAW